MAKKIFRSFDSFISEMKHETASFEMFGKTYEFEKRMPALIPLELARYDDEEDIPPNIMFRAAYVIFGKATIDDLCKHPGFDTEVLNELLKWAFVVINGKNTGEMVELTEDDTAAPERKN